MNREILFRAWDESNKEMINPYCKLKDNRFWGEDLTNTGLITPISVMQFTGLFDKNGIKIYEGDICRVGKYIGVVGFSCGCYDISGWAISFRIEKTEVIGNIYDNPELLESVS